MQERTFIQWISAALLFITPWWAGTNILLVGGINLVLLQLIDGGTQYVSKLCFYCLLLSVLWLLEPLWTPPAPRASARVPDKSAAVAAAAPAGLKRAREGLSTKLLAPSV